MDDEEYMPVLPKEETYRYWRYIEDMEWLLPLWGEEINIKNGYE